MRNLLALIGLAVVLFFGLGWYFNWYSFAVLPGADGQKRIELNVNTNKIVNDTKSGVETVGEVIKNRSANETPATNRSTSETPSNANSTPTPTPNAAPTQNGNSQPIRFQDLPSFFRPARPQ
ncbi:MAG: hypothetical protein LC104_11950 [Bacteroidales bacterium]|nr:hypothetical protein [Bacteroidales bacterium]